MNDEELHHRRSEISDRLAYPMAYAPVFPAEDRTSLPKEKEEMFALIDRFEGDYATAAMHPRFSLFKIEVREAFEAAAAAASDAARRFQIASERFVETFSPVSKGPDFIAGPSDIFKS